MLTIRYAKKDDSIDIFNWRNDKHTQKMSLSKNIITKIEHDRWFNSQINNKKNIIFILELKKELTKKVCVVRYNIENDTALVSINLSPEMRGKKLAVKCLKHSMSFFKFHHPNIHTINAQILAINIPSIISFESVGFIHEKTINDILYYQYNVLEF